jgi:NADH dehydrogenase (ubiquinone) 1 alpha subcomplex subunit 5
MHCTRVLRTAKWPTGITGLVHHPQPRSQLLGVYAATLESLKEIPEHAVYRQSVEALTNERLKIVESTEYTNNIEARIGQGLVEEIIDAAEKELVLVEKMKQWKPYYLTSRSFGLIIRWEKLEVEPPEGQWTTKATLEQ